MDTKISACYSTAEKYNLSAARSKKAVFTGQGTPVGMETRTLVISCGVFPIM